MELRQAAPADQTPDRVVGHARHQDHLRDVRQALHAHQGLPAVLQHAVPHEAAAEQRATDDR